MSEIVIRPMQEFDAPAVAAMVRALAAHIESPDRSRTTADSLVEHGFRGDPAFETIVAETDGRLAGYCLMTRTYSTWRATPGVFVVDLFVDDTVRGRGVGRKLLAEAAAWGERRGCGFLKLDVAPDNHVARRFYKGLGFRDDHDHIMVIEHGDLGAIENG